MSNNTCLINQNGGPISVEVSVDNGIRATGTFWLWVSENGQFKDVDADKHTKSTGDTGSHTFTLHTSPSKLNEGALTWVINSCSMVPAVNEGKLRIRLYQNGERLKTTKDILSTGQFPQCSKGKQRQIKNEVYFKFLPAPNTTELWRNMNVPSS